MGNISTVHVYECERYFNKEIQKLKNTINNDRYNNFCDEFETFQYKSNLINILTNIEKLNCHFKEK